MQPRRSSSSVRRLEVRRPFGTRPEEELFHLRLEKLAGLRLDWREPVLVDEHDLVLDPAGPALARDLLEDALSQRARVGHAIEAGRFALEDDAGDHAGHVMLWISAETGAGSPRRSGWAGLYQSVGGSSITPAQASQLASSGVISSSKCVKAWRTMARERGSMTAERRRVAA